MKRHLVLPLVLLLGVGVLANCLAVQRSASRAKRKRAKPPTFTESQARRTFFNNVFTEALHGERPADLNASQPAVGTTRGGASGAENYPVATSGVYAWKEIIAPEALEDEVKNRKMSVDQNVTTPNRFAGGGYRTIRNEFSMLAMTFAIIGEYDGEVRWKTDAPGIRDSFARSAANAKVGSPQSFNEAKMRKQDLQDLINGGSIVTAGESDRKATWENVVDRAPLMVRLESALQERLQPGMASENALRENQESVVHEANIVAAIGEVLVQEGMEESEEEDYTIHAKTMKQAARDLLAAIELGSYQNAVQAVGAINKSCSQCHADWR